MGNRFRVEGSADAVSTMPQSGLTSTDRRESVEVQPTVGAETTGPSNLVPRVPVFVHRHEAGREEEASR